MERNNLYPIFLKTDQLRILIVGGGFVAEEKLHFLLKSSPDASVTLVSPLLGEGTLEAGAGFQTTFCQEPYHPDYLLGHHLVIAATNDPDVNRQVFEDCRKRRILVNVADTPSLCDFYMGGIVTKGHVKIAISTNGKSPTTAKRLRQFFEAILPEDISLLVENLNTYRRKLKGSFEDKVSRMNDITKPLVEED